MFLQWKSNKHNVLCGVPGVHPGPGFTRMPGCAKVQVYVAPLLGSGRTIVSRKDNERKCSRRKKNKKELCKFSPWFLGKLLMVSSTPLVAAVPTGFASWNMKEIPEIVWTV